MKRKELGALLRQIREHRGLSKRRVYKDNMNNTQLDAIENGTANYTVDNLLLYLERVNVDILGHLKKEL